MRYVLGIDAGGTKTVGLLADETGRVLEEARSSGANLRTHGELGVEKVFAEILECLSERHPVAALCLGIAGVDRPQDEAVIRGILKRLGFRKTARVVNDALIALVAGVPNGIGLAILSGTGSICYGRDRTGRTARAGGYGYLLADEGSGYWFGHQALRAAVRAGDGRGPDTLLKERLFSKLGVGSVDDLIPRVYESHFPKYEIAALSSVVQEAADAGDVVAADLLSAGARELALGAHAVLGQLDFGGGPVPAVLAGGVYTACPTVQQQLERSLAGLAAPVVPLSIEPAQGAVRLALELLSSSSAPA